MAQPGLPYTTAQQGLNYILVAQSIVQGGSVEYLDVDYPKGRAMEVGEFRGMSKTGSTLLAISLTNQSAPDYEWIISEHRTAGDMWTVRVVKEIEFNHAPLIAETWVFNLDNYTHETGSQGNRHKEAYGWPAAQAGTNRVYEGAEIVETGTKQHNGTDFRVAKVQVNERWVAMNPPGAMEWANQLRGGQKNKDRKYADLIRVEWDGSGMYNVHRTAVYEIDNRPDTPNIVWNFGIPA